MERGREDGTFDEWLLNCIAPYKLDDDTFVNYIKGLLEEESEKEDELFQILADFLAASSPDIEAAQLSEEIMTRWKSQLQEPLPPQTTLPKPPGGPACNLEEYIRQQVEAQQPPLLNTTGQREADIDSINASLKSRLLAQYSDIPVDDTEESDREDSSESAPADTILVKIDNAKAVNDQVRAERERLKHEHMERKQQIQMAKQLEHSRRLERQEREKKRTQKVERKK